MLHGKLKHLRQWYLDVDHQSSAVLWDTLWMRFCWRLPTTARPRRVSDSSCDVLLWQALLVCVKILPGMRTQRINSVGRVAKRETWRLRKWVGIYLYVPPFYQMGVHITSHKHKPVSYRGNTDCLTLSSSPPVRNRDFSPQPCPRCTLIGHPLNSQLAVWGSFTPARFHDAERESTDRDIFNLKHKNIWIAFASDWYKILYGKDFL